MNIIKAPVGVNLTNCYIIYDDNKKGIIVDPGSNPKKLLKIVEDENLNIGFIVLTHGHGDHIGGVIEIKEKLKVDVVAHKAERELLKDPNINLSAIMDMESISMDADIYVEEGDYIQYGQIKGRVLHTPGHTKGSMCIDFGEKVLTGDTIFQGSIGRTDFPGGSPIDILKSIEEKIFTLDDKSILLTGHGENSSVGYEKVFNPFLK